MGKFVFTLAVGVVNAWSNRHAEKAEKERAARFFEGIVERTSVRHTMRVDDGEGSMTTLRVVLLQGQSTPVECEDTASLSLIQPGDKVRVYGDGTITRA